MRKRIEIPKVRDLLIRNAVALSSTFSTLDALRCFSKYQISSAPVLNENQEVIGFLSASDIIQCMSNCLFHDETRNPTIESIVTKEVNAASPDWDVFELEKFFVLQHIRVAPVLDSQSHLIGMVTREAAIKVLEELMEQRLRDKVKIKVPLELNLYTQVRMTIDGM